jgi:arylsulfatase A-like enzyme
MRNLRRGLLLGLAFGLAAAAVEAWLQLVPFTQRRFGPGPLFFARVAGIELVLAGLLGLAASPLLALRGGASLLLLAVALAWYGLERWVALESPVFTQLELVPPVAGAVLALGGVWLARRRPLLPWAVGALGLAAAVAAPPVYLRLTTPPAPPRAALPPAPAGAPDVVLVVLDTVRAPNLASYGYGRPTDPELAALAREGALFLDATSPSTWSLPSHASLFTGRYPSAHGAHGEHRFLDARFPTLAQVLAHHGYDTLCFTSNAWISDGLGLTRGFAWQDPSWKSGGAAVGFSFVHRLLDRLGLVEADKGGGVVASHFEDWARERPAGGRPAFVFLNFIEAHFPYHQLPHEDLWRFTRLPYGTLRALSVDLVAQQFGGPGRPLEEAAAPARDMYDGGVAYTSRLLDRVVGALRARGSLDRTVLVVLADHGEILGERDGFFGHGPSLYQEVVHVPLLVRYPPRVPAGVRVAEPVTTLGVFATILDLAGVAPPPTLQAGSLLPYLAGAPPGGSDPILAELHPLASVGVERTYDDPQMQNDRRYRLLREGPVKLVATSRGEHFLYDLAADPRERRDLAAERPAELERLRARLAEVETRLGLAALDAPLGQDGAPPELDAATREQLRALGYAE